VSVFRVPVSISGWGRDVSDVSSVGSTCLLIHYIWRKEWRGGESLEESRKGKDRKEGDGGREKGRRCNQNTKLNEMCKQSGMLWSNGNASPNHFHYTASADKKLGRSFELGCSSLQKIMTTAVHTPGNDSLTE